MKRNFFKSKTAGLLLASLVIISTAFLVTACGGKSEPEKLDRTNNVEVVNILQDYQLAQHKNWIVLRPLKSFKTLAFLLVFFLLLSKYRSLDAI